MWSEILIGGISFIYITLILSTAVVVVMENRQPAKTIAWLLVLVLLPVVGFLIFYFFGQNIRKERFIGRKTFDLLTKLMLNESSYCPPELMQPKYERLIRLNEWKNRAILTAGNETQLITSGEDFVQELLRAIYAANEHIHLETYIIEDDAAGRLIRDALVDRAREGVEVRLLYDDVGCWKVPNKFFGSFIAGGVRVQAFLPVKFPSMTHRINYRNHRKVCVIDGRVGFIGGMNIAERYMNRSGYIWRDQHMKIVGDAVSSLQRLFVSDWYFMSNTLLKDAKYFPTNQMSVAFTRGALMQIVSANPVSRYPEIMYSITWTIQHAVRYLYIQTPYFLPTEPVIQALQTASMSGVDVRLMIPEKPDAFWLRWGNDSYLSAMLRAGVRIFAYQNGFLHSKSIVADDDWCTVGSSNMDFRSFENNFEANAFIYDTNTALQVKKVFLEDLESCEEILLENWRKRPLLNRCLESLTRIFSPLL